MPCSRRRWMALLRRAMGNAARERHSSNGKADLAFGDGTPWRDGATPSTIKDDTQKSPRGFIIQPGTTKGVPTLGNSINLRPALKGLQHRKGKFGARGASSRPSRLRRTGAIRLRSLEQVEKSATARGPEFGQGQKQITKTA